MFAYEIQILQRLAVLVVCHDLAVGQVVSQYLLVQRPMPWFKAQEYCQRHYVDLAVLSREEQYFTLLNATAAKPGSFWLGLQRQNTSSAWQWVDGVEPSYQHWYRKNYEGRCASLEAVLKTDDKLLARYCDEWHMFVCQGPVSPQPVKVDSVGTEHVILHWNVSAFMQMTQHSYNVTTCANNTCHTLLYPDNDGSVSMNISIYNLTSATEYFIEISASVVRPDDVNGRNTTLRSNPITLEVKTVACDGQSKVIILILRSLKLISLAPPLWILYRVLKKRMSPFLYEYKESDFSPVELSTEGTIIDLIPGKIRGVG